MKKVFTCLMAMAWLCAARGQQAGGLMRDPQKPGKIERTISFKEEDRSADDQLKQLLAPGNGQQYLKQKTKQDKQLGLQTDVYQLYLKGVRVLGSEMRVVKERGKLKYALQSRALLSQDINVKTRLNTTQAFDAFIKKENVRTYAWQDPKLEKALKERKRDPAASYFPKGELVIFPETGKPAYLFEVYATDPYKKEQVLVDAQNGEVVKRYDLINSEFSLPTPLIKQPLPTSNAKANNNLQIAEIWMKVNEEDRSSFGSYDPQSDQYYLNNIASNIHTQKINGVYKKAPDGDPEEFISSYNTGVDGVGDFRSYDNDVKYRNGTLVHYGMNTAYNYFLSTRNRLGFDGTNSPAFGYVYMAALTGSFYNREDGFFFPYDNGQTNDTCFIQPSLKTIYHEYSHAFTVSESGLVAGASESGSLNEALSDIWSYIIVDDYFHKNIAPNYPNPDEIEAVWGNDWETRSGNTAFQNYYTEKMGYSVIRNAKNPHSYNYPAFYLGKYWNLFPSDEHYNSTVVSHWFYLLSEGGTVSLENNPAVSVDINGLGIKDAANIVYLTTTNFLGSYTDFHHFAMQTKLAAIILFGENSPQVQAVIDSWLAVGIDQLDFGSNLACTPPDNVQSKFYVRDFELANIKNTKPKDFGGTYQDFTYLNLEVKPGYDYEIFLTADGSKQLPKPLYWSIWFDSDRSDTFEPNEKIYTVQGSWIKNTIKFPPLLKGDHTNLRVVVSADPNASPCYDPAHDVSEKYIEDYGIFVRDYCPIVKWTNTDFLKGNDQFTGIYFNNIKLTACGGTEVFNTFPSNQQNLIDESQKTLIGGQAYSLSFNFKPTPGVELKPIEGGTNNKFSENCETQPPGGFSLGDFNEVLKKDSEEAGTAEVLEAQCPMVKDDKEEFMICPQRFRRFMWIDFNRNGVFETNEKYDTMYDMNTKRFYVNFTVPNWATTLEGLTDLRIYAYLGNGALYNADPCGNGVNGYSDKVFTGEPVISKNGIDILINIQKQQYVFDMKAPTDNISEPSPTSATASYEPVSLNVYPNPANDWVDISVKGTTTDNFTLVVYSAEGMRMLVQQPWNGRGLDVSKFPNGVYIINLQRDRELYTQKLMIQR